MYRYDHGTLRLLASMGETHFFRERSRIDLVDMEKKEKGEEEEEEE